MHIYAFSCINPLGQPPPHGHSPHTRLKRAVGDQADAVATRADSCDAWDDAGFGFNNRALQTDKH
jgi:hypothetical protein